MPDSGDHQHSISPPPAKRVRLESEDATLSRRLPPIVQTSDASVSQRPPELLRIYSWNINGIAPFLQPSIASFGFRIDAGPGADTGNSGHHATPGVASLRGFLRRHNWPHVTQLQEVKMNPSNGAVIRAVETAVNKRLGKSDDGPTYTVKFCLPKDRYNATGFGRKVYGVASIFRDDFLKDRVDRVREVDWDLEGRVLVTETWSKLAIFNIYAVNGTENPYKNPETGEVQGTRHDRKLAFHTKLMEECMSLESRGYDVVIAGDINVAPAPIDGHPRLRTIPQQHVRNRKDFHDKFLRPAKDSHGLDAVDSFRYLHPDEKKYSWLSRATEWMGSCDRVDLILLSRRLVMSGALIEADICMTPADRGTSDHVPIYVSLSV